jgi:hypothetical protein
VSDSVKLNVDREVSFSTPAGKAVPAHCVALFFSGGRESPPNVKALFVVAHASYQRALKEELFGLSADAAGDAEPFAADKPVELEAELDADLTKDLITRGGGAEELVGALMGQANAFTKIAAAASWQAVSVMQDDGGMKSGYSLGSA